MGMFTRKAEKWEPPKIVGEGEPGTPAYYRDLTEKYDAAAKLAPRTERPKLTRMAVHYRQLASRQ